MIVGNPGGPGVSGVDFVLGIVRLPVTARLREHFDIVSFDPRGVARSREVRCTLDASPIPDDADDATLIRLFDEFSERYVRACLDQNGSFVAHVGTMNTARDVEMLRRALGERQITYAAGSYGTVLGAAYASMFPSSVRAMMLDGAIPPDFRDYLMESWGLAVTKCLRVVGDRCTARCCMVQVIDNWIDSVRVISADDPPRPH